jgi:flavin reductase (DIM6/NTAB) family NADH-FMN oxidoreductase RutF
MNKFKEIKPEELNKNPFKLIGSEWMLITAKNEDQVNTMTASWGGFGVMWNKNVAHVVIRPQRYTKEFIDNSDTFSLTFFHEKFKKELSYIGCTSGKNEDKISKANLTTKYLDSTPYFDEAGIVIICKKLYAQEFKPECFIESDLSEKVYPQKDFHTMYFGEIKKILIKE